MSKKTWAIKSYSYSSLPCSPKMSFLCFIEWKKIVGCHSFIFQSSHCVNDHKNWPMRPAKEDDTGVYHSKSLFSYFVCRLISVTTIHVPINHSKLHVTWCWLPVLCHFVTNLFTISGNNSAVVCYWKGCDIEREEEDRCTNASIHNCILKILKNWKFHCKCY